MPVVLALVTALVVAAPVPPAPRRWVEDEAGFLSPAARTALDARLESYERSTGHQVVVWIGTTIGGRPLEDWAVQTFAAWKLGRAGKDDGLAVFVLTEDHLIDIEVGYGLEDRVPDATAARIIHDVMVPKMEAGDRDGAIRGGVDAVLAAIEGKAWDGSAARPREEPAPWTDYVLGGLGVLVLVIMFIKNPRLGMAVMWFLSSGNRRSGGNGGGGGGGGFRGGGGRSGGGGARGHW